MTAYRIETDSLGTVKVPAKAYYGAHTVRSLENFRISRIRLHPMQVWALAMLKMACAQANRELKTLPARKARAITQACREITQGKFADSICLDIFQAGSGTSSNMNINEVIANRAAQILGGKRGDRRLVHPNDDVNQAQSTNNVFPASIRVAASRLADDLDGSLRHLITILKRKAQQLRAVLKSGRTHLQDAVPVTLGQSFHAWATAMEKHLKRLEDSRPYLQVVGIGGSAIGTGLNTYPDFRELILKYLVQYSKMSFQATHDGVESTQFLTDLAEVSGIARLIALDLSKICNDLRLLSSGPTTGLAEIRLPPVEPGSSIMPGKVNPSICESVNMVCLQVIGNDMTVALACQAGQLELNTHMPVVGHNLLESLEILANAITNLTDRCIAGICADKQRCRQYVEHSLGIATALNPHIGYDKSAQLVKESQVTGRSLRELVLEHGYLTEKRVKEILDPEAMTAPNLRHKVRTIRKRD